MVSVRQKDSHAGVKVSINITAHREGYYLYKSIKSAVQNADTAFKNAGVETSININLDNADGLTTSIAKNFSAGRWPLSVYENSFGDLSSSRNFLVSKSIGEYILFVDGDDLFSDNFLYRAVATAQGHGQPCVVSASNIVKFGEQIDPIIFRTESTLQSPEIKSALFETNLYVSQNLVSRSIFDNCSYVSNNSIYGFEDWQWNTQVVNAGFEFLVAPDTSFFYRQKPDDKSLLKQSTNSNTILRPTGLFEPRNFCSQPHKRYVRPSNDTVGGVRMRSRQVISAKVGTSSLIYRSMRSAYWLAQRTAAPFLHRARHYVRKRSEVTTPIINTRPHEGLRPHVVTATELGTWNRLNRIEPLINMSKSVQAELRDYYYTYEHSLATSYHDFCAKYGDKKFHDAIFVPWINRGGADAAMIDLARTLSEEGRNVLVISTSGIDSEWKNEIEDVPNLVFLQSHDSIINHLDHNNIKLFFLRVVQNWGVETVTVMNSAIGFELLSRHGKALKDIGCRVFVHSFAFPLEEERIIEPFPSFPASLEYVDKIIVDSNVHKSMITNLYGVPKDSVVKVPLAATGDVRVKHGGVTNKILFANRFAREKRPDFAIRTLRNLSNDGVAMHMYGSKDERYCESIGIDELISASNNVEYLGLFDGTSALDFDKYDICLLTSLYEGIPRICIDAVRANLFVVCTDVGGLGEIVKDRKNGYLLKPDATPEDFASAIRDYYASPALQDLSNRSRFNQSIVRAHSMANYKKSMRKLYGLQEMSRG